MRARLSVIVIAVVSGCDGKTASTAIGISTDGTGGESWSTHDAASGGAGDVIASGGARSAAVDAATKIDAGGPPAAPLPACPNLTSIVDGGSEATCFGARTALVCRVVKDMAASGAAGETCLSDNATRCPPGPFTVSGSLACQDRCEPTEYAVGCGGAAAGAPLTVTLPPECREINGRYGALYCCPCGS